MVHAISTQAHPLSIRIRIHCRASFFAPNRCVMREEREVSSHEVRYFDVASNGYTFHLTADTFCLHQLQTIQSIFDVEIMG